MVGPYDTDTASCISATMFEAGLTSDQAQEFLDEDDDNPPTAFDLYTDALIDCEPAAIGRDAEG